MAICDAVATSLQHFTGAYPDVTRAIVTGCRSVVETCVWAGLNAHRPGAGHLFWIASCARVERACSKLLQALDTRFEST
ncbi:hypothetical protein [Subtercola vilae]|nr:hypothetical protein [Subtercola vilae]